MRINFIAVLTVTAGVTAAQAAMAADLPARMPTKAPAAIVAHSWTGCYIGGNVGGLWGRSRFTDTTTGVDIDLGSHTADGVIAGGQIGCNYQTGPWVVGVEGMFDWTNSDGEHVTTAGPATPGIPVTIRTESNWLATATARVGYAVDRNLFYVKGGGAWLNGSGTATASVGGATLIVSSGNHTLSGWTVGAGWEHAFAPGWSAKIEYGYFDFGESSPAGCSNLTGLCSPAGPVDSTAHMVLVGLNYKFGSLWR